MKLTVDKQRELFPDEEIRAAFLRRDDIAALSTEEQEARWQKHLVRLNEFRDRLSGLNCIVLGDPDQ